RYAVEYVAPLYARKPVQSFLKGCKDLQRVEASRLAGAARAELTRLRQRGYAIERWQQRGNVTTYRIPHARQRQERTREEGWRRRFPGRTAKCLIPPPRKNRHFQTASPSHCRQGLSQP